MSPVAHNFKFVYVGAALRALRKRPDLSNRQALCYLILAVSFTLVLPVLQGLFEQSSGAAEVFLVFPFFGISSGVAFYCFTRERIKVGFLSLALFALGACLAAISVVLFSGSGGATFRGSFASVPATVSILNQAVVLPFYEELVVRTFLFMGLAKFVGFGISAISVSLLFGLAHGQIPVFAFSASILLCYLAYRDVGVFDRTVLHGSYNLALIVLVVLGGRA